MGGTESVRRQLLRQQPEQQVFPRFDPVTHDLDGQRVVEPVRDEPGEAVRLLPFLKPDGQMVVSSRPVMPVTAALADTGYRAETMLEYLSSRVSRLTVVDAEKALKEVGSPKVLNLILLGAALRSGALGLEAEDLKDAVRRLIPEKFHELNFRALDYEP